MSNTHLQEELESLRREVAALSRAQRSRRRGLLAASAAVVLAIATGAVAQPTLRPFTAGAPALASDVNAQLNLLRDWSVPTGTIAFFASACPSGWTDYAAAQGRAIVAVPASGTVTQAFGTAFSGNNEKFHAHTGVTADLTGSRYGNGEVNYQVIPGVATPYQMRQALAVDATPTSAVMPYIYLRACQKAPPPPP